MLQDVCLRRTGLHCACGGADLFDFGEIGLEWLCDSDDFYAHLHRQRVCGNVVRPLRRSTGIFAQIRIGLPFHHRFGECAKWLSDANHITSFWILDAVGCKCRVRPFDFDFPELQNVQHLNRTDRVTLFRRNNKCERRAVPGNGPLLDGVEIAQPTFTIKRHVLERAHRSREFVIDDIAQMPLASTPQSGKLPTDRSGIVTNTRTQIAEVLLDRRGILHAGRFCQDSDRPMIVLIRSRRSP